MWVLGLFVLGFCSRTVGADDSDQTWLSWLETPPPSAVELAGLLNTRADQLVSALPSGSTFVGGDVDVVCSGGGNLDAYFMGASMVMNRVAARDKTQPKGLRMHRFAGASAGGMMPFELALKGENTTLVSHLSYGFLVEKYPKDFSNDLFAAAKQDHHWRLMAAWQSKKWASLLSSLDGRVFLALSCLTPLPTLVKVSNFTSPKQATSAFMATGTAVQFYDDMLCSDGGSESGPKMTPLFQDAARPQIIVDLMETGFPLDMVVRFNSTEYARLIRHGQDDAVQFLQTGKTPKAAISLCPKTANTKKNLCQ